MYDREQTGAKVGKVKLKSGRHVVEGRFEVDLSAYFCKGFKFVLILPSSHVITRALTDDDLILTSQSTQHGTHEFAIPN